jgi:hypothetical protein
MIHQINLRIFLRFNKLRGCAASALARGSLIRTVWKLINIPLSCLSSLTMPICPILGWGVNLLWMVDLALHRLLKIGPSADQNQNIWLNPKVL